MDCTLHALHVACCTFSADKNRLRHSGTREPHLFDVRSLPVAAESDVSAQEPSPPVLETFDVPQDERALADDASRGLPKMSNKIKNPKIAQPRATPAPSKLTTTIPIPPIPIWDREPGVYSLEETEGFHASINQVSNRNRMSCDTIPRKYTYFNADVNVFCCADVDLRDDFTVVGAEGTWMFEGFENSTLSWNITVTESDAFVTANMSAVPAYPTAAGNLTFDFLRNATDIRFCWMHRVLNATDEGRFELAVKFDVRHVNLTLDEMTSLENRTLLEYMESDAGGEGELRSGTVDLIFIGELSYIYVQYIHTYVCNTRGVAMGGSLAAVAATPPF